MMGEAALDAYAVLAAAAFAEERRAHFLALGAEVDRTRAWLALEEQAGKARRRAQGELWAKRLGLSAALSDVVAVLVYSPSKLARIRAADIIGRALRRTARKAAAA